MMHMARISVDLPLRNDRRDFSLVLGDVTSLLVSSNYVISPFFLISLMYWPVRIVFIADRLPKLAYPATTL